MAYIQVGVIALRSPTGEFLPSEPIYDEIPDKQLTASGTTKQDETACNELAKLLAQKYRCYKMGLKDLGIK